MPPPPVRSPELSLWRRFHDTRSARRLRVGVLMGARGMDAWMARIVESLGGLKEVEVAGFFVTPEGAVREDAAPALFRKLEAWSRSGGVALFELAEAGVAAKDAAFIAAQGLDVLLVAAPLRLAGDCAKLARFGVWRLLLGEPEFAGYQPPLWREVYEDRAVTRVFLSVHDKRFEVGRIADSFALSTVASLKFTSNQGIPIQAAGLTLRRVLLDAVMRDAAPDGGEEIRFDAGEPRWPSAIETAKFVGGKLARSAQLRMASRGKSQRWMVGIRKFSGAVDLQNAARGERFAEVPNPPGHYYADPFVIEHESRHWLFVEDWLDSEERARLVCLEILNDGGFGEPVTILDQPFHLSYPHVFRHGGEFFMIPESYYGTNVELYRATKFPFEWKLEHVLMDDVRLVDTTPLFHDGTWYFFTSTALEPEEGYLFTADRLDGAWKYHPANPICADTRRLRGAGAIFSQSGALIRPVQNCSRGYGYALAFSEIRRLSPVEFEERQVGSLLPEWEPGLTGVHTMNFDSKYQVVDVQRLTATSHM